MRFTKIQKIPAINSGYLFFEGIAIYNLRSLIQIKTFLGAVKFIIKSGASFKDVLNIIKEFLQFTQNDEGGGGSKPVLFNENDN